SGTPTGFELRARPDLDKWQIIHLGATATELGTSEDAPVGKSAPICAGTWSDVRDGAGTHAERTAVVGRAAIQMCSTTNQYQAIWRTILVFNVTGQAQPQSASVIVRLVGLQNGHPGQVVGLVGATPADPDMLVAS